MKKHYLSLVIFTILISLSYTGLCAGTPDIGSYMMLRLAKDAVNTDETMIRFKNGASTDYVWDEDAPYFQGFGQVNLATISTNNTLLAINEMPFPPGSSATALWFNTSASGTYTLAIQDLVEVPDLYEIFLVDLHSKTSIDFRANPNYTFMVDKTDSSTFGSRRFCILFHQKANLEYHLTSFNVDATNNGVEVGWKTINEQTYTRFKVERSNDEGQIFAAIDSIAGDGSGNYSFFDKTPPEGKNLYRLKQYSISDSISFSNVVTIIFSNKNNGPVNNLHIYPNPVVSNMSLAIANSGGDSYDIQVSNSSGILVKQATAAEANWQADVTDLKPGIYLIKVYNSRDKSLVGNGKFVKL